MDVGLRKTKFKKGLGLNAKLFLIFILLSLLPISFVGLVTVSRTIKELKKEAFERFEEYHREAERINLILSQVSSSSKSLADYATRVYNNPELFYTLFYSAKIREGPPKPSLAHIKHVALLGLFSNN